MQSNAEICQKIGQSCLDKTSTRGFFAKAASPCYCTFLSMSIFFLELLALKINEVGAVPDSVPIPNTLNRRNYSCISGLPANTQHRYITSTSGYPSISPNSSVLQTESMPNMTNTSTSGPNLSKCKWGKSSCLLDKFHDFMNILDALPRHATVTRTKRQFNLITFCIATGGLTLATYKAVLISKNILANESLDWHHEPPQAKFQSCGHKTWWHLKPTCHHASSQQGPLRPNHQSHGTKILCGNRNLWMTHPHRLQSPTRR